jgi:hypothetical protein
MFRRTQLGYFDRAVDCVNVYNKTSNGQLGVNVGGRMCLGGFTVPELKSLWSFVGERVVEYVRLERTEFPHKLIAKSINSHTYRLFVGLIAEAISSEYYIGRNFRIPNQKPCSKERIQRGLKGQIQSLKGQIQSLKGQIQKSSKERIQRGLKGQIQKSLKGQIQSSNGRIQSLKGQIQSSKGRIQSSKEQMQSSKGRIQSSKGQIQSSKGQIQSSKGQIQRALDSDSTSESTSDSDSESTSDSDSDSTSDSVAIEIMCVLARN